jgi:hypothetical protein
MPLRSGPLEKREFAMTAKPRDEKPSVTLPGTVEKIIPPITPEHPEKAQIAIEGAEDLYKEIRVENTLHDENGKPVALKPGVKVDVTIEADKTATKPKAPAE